MKRRMHNIFKEDGKALIVAMDHGTGAPVLPDLKEPGEVIRQCVAGGADGFLVTPGMAMKFKKEIKNTAMFLRSDGGSNTLTTKGAPFRKSVSVEQAIRLGSDAMLCMDFPGGEDEIDTAESVAKLVEGGIEWNMPICVEPLPRGFEFDKYDDLRTPENITMVARMAVERGADMVKVPYTGDKESFRELVESCYVPVLMLGGDARDDVSTFLQDIKDGLDVGAAGVIVGRNIYKSQSPEEMTRALARLIHENVEVEEAMKELSYLWTKS